MIPGDEEMKPLKSWVILYLFNTTIAKPSKNHLLLNPIRARMPKSMAPMPAAYPGLSWIRCLRIDFDGSKSSTWISYLSWNSTT